MPKCRCWRLWNCSICSFVVPCIFVLLFRSDAFLLWWPCPLVWQSFRRASELGEAAWVWVASNDEITGWLCCKITLQFQGCLLWILLNLTICFSIPKSKSQRYTDTKWIKMNGIEKIQRSSKIQQKICCPTACSPQCSQWTQGSSLWSYGDVRDIVIT